MYAKGDNTNKIPFQIFLKEASLIFSISIPAKRAIPKLERTAVLSHSLKRVISGVLLGNILLYLLKYFFRYTLEIKLNA